MTPTTVICKMPLGYNDFGACALTEHGMEVFDQMICDKLPDSVFWCGDELIGDYGVDYDFDINEIISECAAKMLAIDDPDIWEEY